MGSIFQNVYNLNTVPSPVNRSPNGERYYSGGYITKTYSQFNRMNVIQAELPYSLRTSDSYKNSSMIIAKAIYDFYAENGLNEMVSAATKATHQICLLFTIMLLGFNLNFYQNLF